MVVQSKTLIGCALASLLSFAAGAQTTNSLSLKECLDLALAHNLNLQIARYNPRISQYTLKAAYGAYDPTLNLTAQRAWDNEPAQFNPKKYPNPTGVRLNSEYELKVDSAGPSLGGSLPSGLSYNLFARADHLDAKTFPTSLDLLGPFIGPVYTNDYYATAGLTLSQPLLKNFWIDLPRFNIQTGKKDLQISEETLRLQIMTIATKVATAYYNLSFAREQVAVQNGALELGERLLDDVRKKVQVGTLTALDQQQAESDLETIRTALFAAEQNYSVQENLLKNLLSESYQTWINVSLVPSESLTVPDLPPNRTASWVTALTLRPELAQMRLNLEKQDINVRFTFNQLFPSLNVYGSYGWQAVDPHFSGSWTDVQNGRNPYYSAGIVASFPLGNITARNNYKAAKLGKEQAVVELNKLQGDIITEVENAVKAAETSYKQISSTKKARDTAELALAAVNTQYQAGTLAAFFVVEAREKLTRASFAYIRALADYNIALANLALSEGSTLEKNRLTLKMK